MTHSTSPESVTVKVTESSGMVLVMVCPPFLALCSTVKFLIYTLVLLKSESPDCKSS